MSKHPLLKKYKTGIVIVKSSTTAGIKIITWTHGTAATSSIPIFSTETKSASMNLISAGLAVLGILPPSPDEGNIVMTMGRGLLDEDGEFLEEQARAAVRALVTVLMSLGDMMRIHQPGMIACVWYLRDDPHRLLR